MDCFSYPPSDAIAGPLNDTFSPFCFFAVFVSFLRIFLPPFQETRYHAAPSIRPTVNLQDDVSVESPPHPPSRFRLLFFVSKRTLFTVRSFIRLLSFNRSVSGTPSPFMRSFQSPFFCPNMASRFWGLLCEALAGPSAGPGRFSPFLWRIACFLS